MIAGSLLCKRAIRRFEKNATSSEVNGGSAFGILVLANFSISSHYVANCSTAKFCYVCQI